MTKRQFRIAVVLPVVLTVLAVVASCVGESSLPPPLQEHLRQERDAELTVADWVLIALALPLLAGYVAAFVGLLKFRPHSGSLNIVMSAVGLIALPLAGPTVEPESRPRCSTRQACCTAPSSQSPSIDRWPTGFRTERHQRPHAPTAPDYSERALCGGLEVQVLNQSAFALNRAKVTGLLSNRHSSNPRTHRDVPTCCRPVDASFTPEAWPQSDSDWE